MLEFFRKEGTKRGYKNFRIDVDASTAAKVCDIYRRLRLLEERYNRIDDVPPGRYRDIRIFSKSLLQDSTVTPWNNRPLFFSSPVFYGCDEIGDK